MLSRHRKSQELEVQAGLRPAVLSSSPYMSTGRICGPFFIVPGFRAGRWHVKLDAVRSCTRRSEHRERAEAVLPLLSALAAYAQLCITLQSGHPGSKAFKGSLTLFTFIADVATGPVRCPPSATQNFADAKFRRASSGHRHCPRFYSPFSCVQGQRVGATGAGQGRCPRP